MRVKKRRRRRRFKKKVRIVFIIMLLISIITLLYYFSAIFKIDKNITLNVFDEYEDNVKVISFFKDVTDKVKVDGDLDNTKIGKYNLIYKYKTIFGYSKKKKVCVNVIDNDKPIIELIGGDKVESFLNDEYKELGYNVEDNYDRDLEVIIDGKVDTSKTGNYYIVYKAEDSSGNKTEVVRKVVVERKSPLTMDLKDFNLDDYFEGTILKETKEMSDEYLDNMVIAGDSVPWQFGLNGVFPSSRVWAKPCEGPFNFDSQKVYINNKQSNYTLAELIVSKKPEYLTLHMGVCDTNNDNIEKFIESYGNVIDFIRDKSPDTKLMIMSLMPQIDEYLSWIPLRNNVKLNKYNYYLAELCYNKGVKFLNASSVVKDSTGEGDPRLFFDDGYHPNVQGMKKILNYINNHGYKE